MQRSGTQTAFVYTARMTFSSDVRTQPSEEISLVERRRENIKSFLNATELRFRKITTVFLHITFIIMLYYLHPPTVPRTAFLLQLGSYRGCVFATVCKSLTTSQSSFWLKYADQDTLLSEKASVKYLN
jgi:hypothetical protein